MITLFLLFQLPLLIFAKQVYQFLSLLKSTGEGGGVAWWAHIGGFIAGILIIFFLKNNKKIQREENSPWE